MTGCTALGVFLSDALPGCRKKPMDLHLKYYIRHFDVEKSLLMTLFLVGNIRETQMQHERGPHTHLKHRLSFAWGKTYNIYSHCESGEGLWLQGGAALQMHSFINAEPQNLFQAAQTRHKYQPDQH